MLYLYIWGKWVTYGLQSKSPNALDNDNPLILQSDPSNSIVPPNCSILIFSSGLFGLWSKLNCSAILSLLHFITRESPTFNIHNLFWFSKSLKWIPTHAVDPKCTTALGWSLCNLFWSNSYTLIKYLVA